MRERGQDWKSAVKQQGAVLMVALVFLVVMTMLAMTAMQSATLEEKLASNMVNETIASNAAQAALRDAIDWIDAQGTVVAPDNSNANDGSTGIWTGNSPHADPNPFNNASWDQDESDPNSTIYGGDPTDDSIAASYSLSGVSVQPTYLIAEADSGDFPPNCGATTTPFGCNDASCAVRYWIGVKGVSNGVEAAYLALYNKCYDNFTAGAGGSCDCNGASVQTSEGLSQDRLYGFFRVNP